MSVLRSNIGLYSTIRIAIVSSREDVGNRHASLRSTRNFAFPRSYGRRLVIRMFSSVGTYRVASSIVVAPLACVTLIEPRIKRDISVASSLPTKQILERDELYVLSYSRRLASYAMSPAREVGTPGQ